MPFSQNIRFLEKKQKARMSRVLSERCENNGKKSKNSNSNLDEKNYDLWEKYGFICQPLDYIRGQTIANAYIIIEEAQNLSQHEIKTIMTRAGDGTKLIFCGDLSQIDSPYISAKNSGLTYAIERMSGGNHQNKMVGVSILTKTVRSKLSSFASEVM
jgi:PhoH-like ATPase